MSQCKGCGREIIWGRTDDDKKIPLDLRPPVYEALDRMPLKTDGQFVRRNHEAYVSHFVTCPKANEFSASNKKRIQEGEDLNA